MSNDELTDIKIDGLVGWADLPPPVPGIAERAKASGHWGRLAEVLWRTAMEDWQAWQAWQADLQASSSFDHPDYGQPCPPRAVKLTNVRRDRQSYLRTHYSLSTTTRGKRREPILHPDTGRQAVNKAGELRWREICDMWVWADPETAGQVADATAQLSPVEPIDRYGEVDEWFEPDNYTEET